jgi:hypothetical protein
VDIGCLASGSIASSLQGESRSTHDMGIVVNLTQWKVLAIENAAPDYFR